MPSVAKPVGGVTEGPPSPGEPLSRATTAVAGQTHDIVLGGVGFTLYRGNDDSPPSKGYKSEATDLMYQPVFIDRANTGGDLGDDQQDFFMSMVQRDWSGGEGRKFFRRQGGDDAYWAGEGIFPTAVPGQVRCVPGPSIVALTGATGMFVQGNYVKQSGQQSGASDTGDASVFLFGSGAATVVMTYSTGNGDGSNANLVQVTSGATIWKDAIDSCLGDDGYIYYLEGSNTSTQSKIHRIKAPSAVTAAWDNWTANNFQANCMAYWNGGLYVGNSLGRLMLVTSAGGAGTQVKDFGGGVIVQLLATPEGLYALYLSPQGAYKVFLYTGGTPSEVLDLPRGFRANYMIETGNFTDRTATGIFAMKTDAMAWSEGVLYICGLIPARDQAQARRYEATYRTALYYYNAGNSGFIWQADDARMAQAHGSCAAAVIVDGVIAFTDTINHRMMAYDPRTGGVECLCAGVTIADTANKTGTASSAITTAVASNTGEALQASGLPLLPGLVIRNSTQANAERLLYTGTWKRGWNGTTALTATTSTTGDILTYDAWVPMPITRIVFDFDKGWLFYVRHGIDLTAITKPLGVNLATIVPYIPLRSDDSGALANSTGSLQSWQHSWLQSSLFDFESSLSKYFRTIQVDYDTVQMPLRTDEAAGMVHAWYKLDGTMQRPHDPYYRPTDLTPVNTNTVTILTGTASTSSTAPQLLLAAGHGCQVGSIVYGAGGVTDEAAIVSAVNVNTITLSQRGFMGGGLAYRGALQGLAVTGFSATAWATSGVITVQNPVASGTRYNLNATGKQLQVMLQLVCGATSAAVPVSLGPLLRKLVVRAAPIQQGLRRREYQIAMFNDQPRLSTTTTKQNQIPKETRTPHELRAALEALIAAGAPIAVSDGTMTNVTCVVVPEEVKIREIRPAEYVAYTTIREV